MDTSEAQDTKRLARETTSASTYEPSGGGMVWWTVDEKQRMATTKQDFKAFEVNTKRCAS